METTTLSCHSCLHSARLFNCALCHQQCCICSQCDHGNIYCSKQCSGEARRKSLRKSSHHYQKTSKGRHKNAERQRRHRARKADSENLVTHQGSKSSALHGVLPKTLIDEETILPKCTVHEIFCNFCGNCCSSFVRFDFLPYSSEKKDVQLGQCSSKWPSAP